MTSRRLHALAIIVMLSAVAVSVTRATFALGASAPKAVGFPQST